ncbi:hypothetical protein MOO46_00515 [Apilactobacillus apisilvae]|uniref:Uncharacterized protein n=1 Tax=Apilactobacillus apisilvae TaxID=2923364 RepID=A0ABY4PHY6_9LACO|nr:hypothetical protein [Apilactobacillus apisilvae]UQS85123.1 hypothetical protein MOO46_00515 [Apilactobacillus apisilvae]
MKNKIFILEHRHNILKVKYRNEFGYFFPSTILTSKDSLVKSFLDAEQRLLNNLNSKDKLILVPLSFDLKQQLFEIQVLFDYSELGIFNIYSNGNITKKDIT